MDIHSYEKIIKIFAEIYFVMFFIAIALILCIFAITKYVSQINKRLKEIERKQELFYIENIKYMRKITSHNKVIEQFNMELLDIIKTTSSQDS